MDSNRIYLGGYGTGGTLALLTAETSRRFAHVFAFGPAAEIDSYSDAVLPLDVERSDPQELKLRSPIHWLHGIETPTYLIGASIIGASIPGQNGDAEKMCARSRNP